MKSERERPRPSPGLGTAGGGGWTPRRPATGIRGLEPILSPGRGYLQASLDEEQQRRQPVLVDASCLLALVKRAAATVQAVARKGPLLMAIECRVAASLTRVSWRHGVSRTEHRQSAVDRTRSRSERRHGGKRTTQKISSGCRVSLRLAS